jgi:hypothetical protein
MGGAGGAAVKVALLPWPLALLPWPLASLGVFCAANALSRVGPATTRHDARACRLAVKVGAFGPRFARP